MSQLNRDQTRYIDKFIKMSQAPKLLKFFPNTKEITESMGGFFALKKIGLEKLFGQKDVLCVIVGDGTTPRTGALIASATKWDVVSVDPRLKKTYDFNNLACINKNIENAKINYCKYNKIIILMVHSHAYYGEWVEAFSDKEAYIVDIPCCIEDEPPSPFSLKDTYEDKSILGEKNIVYLYDNKIEKETIK